MLEAEGQTKGENEEAKEPAAEKKREELGAKKEPTEKKLGSRIKTESEGKREEKRVPKLGGKKR